MADYSNIANSTSGLGGALQNIFANRQNQNIIRQQEEDRQGLLQQQQKAQDILGQSLILGLSPLQTAERLYAVNPQLGQSYVKFQQEQQQNQQAQIQLEQDRAKTATQAMGSFVAQLNKIPINNKEVKNAFYRNNIESLAQNNLITPQALQLLNGEWTPEKEQFLTQAFNQQMINIGQFRPESDIGKINRDIQLGYITPQEARQRVAQIEGRNRSDVKTIKLTPQDNKRIAELTDQAGSALESLDYINAAQSLLDQGIGQTGGAGGVGKYIGQFQSLKDPDIRSRRQQFENSVTKLGAAMAKTFGANPSEYETKLIQKMQASLNNDLQTNEALLQEASNYMQRRIAKQEYVVNAIDNGISPLKAETMFLREERKKQVEQKNQKTQDYSSLSNKDLLNML